MKSIARLGLPPEFHRQLVELCRLQRRHGLDQLERTERQVLENVIVAAASGTPVRMCDLLLNGTAGRSTVYRHLKHLVARDFVVERGAGRQRVFIPSGAIRAFGAELCALFGSNGL